MTLGHYILDKTGQNIVAVDLMTWATWFEKRRLGVVKQDTIGRSFISTIFLGIDHNFGGGPPVLWETMVFGGTLDREQRRCSGGREQADAMHANIVADAKRAERFWLWLPKLVDLWFDQCYEYAYQIRDWRAARDRQRRVTILRHATEWLRGQIPCAT